MPSTSSLASTLKSTAMRRRAIAMIVIVIVFIIIVAGAATYYVFVFKSPSPPGSPGLTTTTTNIVGTTTKVSNSFKYYKGTFTYSNQIGPTGEMVFPNDTVSMYRTLLSASGSFSFFIDPTNRSGLGGDQGVITATTTGFCTGQTSVNYTFAIPNANTLLYENVTVAFDLPNPQNVTYPLSCINENGVHYLGSGNFTYLSVFPNLITTASIPSTLTLNQSGVYYLILLSNGP